MLGLGVVEVLMMFQMDTNSEAEGRLGVVFGANVVGFVEEPLDLYGSCMN